MVGIANVLNELDMRNRPQTVITAGLIVIEQGGAYTELETREPVRSLWFELAADAGVRQPVIAVWRPEFPSWASAGERKRARMQLTQALDAVGVEIAFERLSGRDVQLYGVMGDLRGIECGQMLDAMALKVNSRIEPGKLLKRLGVYSVSQGAFTGDTGYVLRDMGSRPEKDGALWIRNQAARALCLDAGIEWHDDITRLQVWMLTPTGMVKGMGMVENSRYSQPKGTFNADIAFPSESLDMNVRIDEGVQAKVVAHRVVRHPVTVKPFDGLLRMPELLRYVSAEEVAEVQRDKFMEIDRAYGQFSEDTLMLDLELDEDPGSFELNAMLRSMENRLYDDQVRRFEEAVGGGLYSSPEAMEMGSGQLHRSVSSRRRRWNRGDGNALPGAYVSAVRAYWTDPDFACAKRPKAGYVGVVWNDGDVDGLTMNPADMPCNSVDVAYRSDGGDLDDMLDMVLMRAPSGKTYGWVVRNPTSWQGGWFLRIGASELAGLKGQGYHVYTMTCEPGDRPDVAAMEAGLKVA